MNKIIIWLMITVALSINYLATAQEDNPCRGNEEGVLKVPDPNDCNRFFICIREEPFPAECGDGLIFDVLTGNCNHDLVSVCIKELESPPTPSGPGEETTAPGVTTTDASEDTTTTPAPPAPTPSPATTTISEAPTPSPTTTTTTPLTTTTTPLTTTTTPPTTTTTPPTTTTTTTPTASPTTTSTTQAPTTARPPGTPDCAVYEEFYAPHPDCTMYYRCFFGRLFVMSCPPNQHWNQEQLFCDHIWNVPCPSSWKF
ncbi:mucin-2 isoform X2 [Topomyia yanbarensis]|uniref:mucin-2 isoform X2 n=1 Tax=Topomyia yanbarensis TaxID=2498891 RepID=UPI00273BE981|nr:mucin-2 isoform X2 [Topomyia yanbarensis]